MVIAGMRRAVPKEDQETFLLLARDARPWRTSTAMSNP